MNPALAGSWWMLLAGALVLEGGTIARCLIGGARAGRDGAGWFFLFSEVWVIAFLGLSHAVLPAAVHHVLAAAWLPVTLYVLAWMVRDIALWQVALRLRDRFRPLAALGAAGQLGSALWAIVVGVDAGLPATPHAVPEVTERALSVVAPVCLIIVIALTLCGMRVRRLLGAQAE